MRPCKRAYPVRRLTGRPREVRPTIPSHPLNSASAPAPAQRLRDHVVHLNCSRNLQGCPDSRYCGPCGCKCPPRIERAPESVTTSVRCLTLSVQLTRRYGAVPQRVIRGAENCVARHPRGRLAGAQQTSSTPASGRLALDKDAAAAAIGTTRGHLIAGSASDAEFAQVKSVTSIIDSMTVRSATLSPRRLSRRTRTPCTELHKVLWERLACDGEPLDPGCCGPSNETGSAYSGAPAIVAISRKECGGGSPGRRTRGISVTQRHCVVSRTDRMPPIWLGFIHCRLGADRALRR